MRAQGWEPGDLDETAELWPENWTAWNLFCRMSTRWTPSASGPPTGIDYPSLYPLIDRMASTEAEWWSLFDDVQCLERSALEQMRDDYQPTQT